MSMRGDAAGRHRAAPLRGTRGCKRVPDSTTSPKFHCLLEKPPLGERLTVPIVGTGANSVETTGRANSATQQLPHARDHVVDRETELREQHFGLRRSAEAIDDAEHVAAIAEVAIPALLDPELDGEARRHLRRQHLVAIALR